MSMCLAQECEIGWRERAIHPWLSMRMSVADVCGKPRSARSVRSQMASFAVFAEAMYSALTVESATVGCFFEDQETVPPVTSKTNPATERRSSKSCAQSESVH